MLKEVDRWAEVHERARAIHEFLDFLNEKGISLCEVDSKTDMFYPVPKNRYDLIYECYNINANKLEQERREILELARENSVKVTDN